MHSLYCFLSRFLSRAVLIALGLLIASPLSAQDAAPNEGEAMVRINRLENMMRQMQGQIEELQFANQKLQDQLKFMTPASEPRSLGQGQTGQGQTGQGQTGQGQTGQGQTLPPNASSGTTSSASQPGAQAAAQNNSGPINLLAAGKAPQTPAAPAGPGTPPMTLEQAAAASGQAQRQSAPPQPSASQPVEQKSNFEIAKDAMAAKDYEKAVNVLTGIVEGNPKEPKIPDALIMLGDAQYRLKRYPEAAQRYLKLAQTYPKHPEAPTAFVRLGLSLNEMGQKPQACATFAEFAKRYPNAKSAAKAEADRGKKAASCG